VAVAVPAKNTNTVARIGDFHRVAAALQEAALDAEAWPTALSAFGERLGSKWTVVGAFDRDPRSGYALLRQDLAGERDHLAFFREHYNTPDTNPAVRDLATQRPGCLVPREHAFSDRVWCREPFYREIYRPRGLFHGLGMCVVNDAKQLAIIGVNRPRRAGVFDGRELEELRRTLPHLQRALQVFMTMAATEAANRAHRAAWDLLGCGVILLDRLGKISWTNATAAALLALGDGLVRRNGSLTAVLPSDAAALTPLIRDALLARNDQGLHPGGTLRVQRRSLKRALTVLVSPLRIAECFVHAPAAVVFVTDPESAPEPPAEAYRRLYDLTSREAAVAASLVAGARLADTAAALGMSIHTARTHLRALFRKTETRRQAELVALLARSIGIR
jgi:DNA-binding CsgD family transcriptional regulator